VLGTGANEIAVLTPQRIGCIYVRAGQAVRVDHRFVNAAAGPPANAGPRSNIHCSNTIPLECLVANGLRAPHQR
jgi:hypothetical protein